MTLKSVADTRGGERGRGRKPPPPVILITSDIIYKSASGDYILKSAFFHSFNLENNL